MKIKILVIWVSIEGIYIEDSLDIPGWNLLDSIRFETANPEDREFSARLRSMSVQT
jgi:hypothetical protein